MIMGCVAGSAQSLSLDTCKAMALRNNAAVKNAVLDVKAADRENVEIGVRPEGFIPAENGALTCEKQEVEVMRKIINKIIMMKKIPAENLVLLRRTSMKLRKTRTSAGIFPL